MSRLQGIWSMYCLIACWLLIEMVSCYHCPLSLFSQDKLTLESCLALKTMGSSFVNSYTKMVDGEKDPRNLMLLFSIDRVILLEFEVKDHIEVS